MRPKEVVVNDLMQHGYRYVRTEPEGKNFDPEFTPDLTPYQVLKLGEFPDWYDGVALCHERHAPELNYFGVNASQPLSVWRAKGWIYEEDPRGWFQWYCRYYSGRRIPEEDRRQIKRWKQMVRHVAQVKYACRKGDYTCHTRQRQALLHWAYDSRRI